MSNARILDKNRQSMDSTSLYGEEMKEIVLSNGMCTQVDDDMFEYLNQWKWHLGGSKQEYVTGGLGHRGTVYLHRFIMDAPKEMQVDHIDHNSLNNQRNNLRICTQKENTRHNRFEKRSYSGYKGVHPFRSMNCWRARIRIHKKETHLGVFDISKYAAYAYDRKALELFGEFAYLNFPERKEIYEQQNLCNAPYEGRREKHRKVPQSVSSRERI